MKDDAYISIGPSDRNASPPVLLFRLLLALLQQRSQVSPEQGECRVFLHRQSRQGCLVEEADQVAVRLPVPQHGLGRRESQGGTTRGTPHPSVSADVASRPSAHLVPSRRESRHSREI